MAGADTESLLSAGNSSFDRASLVDDLESVQTRTSMASLRRRRLLMSSAPQFSARLRAKRCSVGQTARFSCCVSGLPQPDVTWSRADGTPLTHGKRIHITVCTGISTTAKPLGHLDRARQRSRPRRSLLAPTTLHGQRKCADTIGTVLTFKYICQVKYKEAILSNSTQKQLWFEITKC